MISIRRSLLLVPVLAGVALLIAIIVGGSARLGAQSETLTVATVEIPPFVERPASDQGDGFYFEIWEDVAQTIDVDYEVVWFDSFSDMLAAVESGQADVAVAPLAPTAEREEVLDFSSAVLSSGPQLGVHDRTRASVSLVATLVGSGALRVVLAAAIGLVILGHMIWLVERRQRDLTDFDPKWPGGVFDGIWWAAVTVTTVGYGDMSPKSRRGRAVGILAMFASLFLVGAFVSQVSADLTAARDQLTVESLDDLDDDRIGTILGSTFEGYLAEREIPIESFDSQIQMFEAAESGEIDFVVANPFALASIGSEYGISPVGDVFYEEFETFGLAQGSPWREPINQALSDLQRSGQIQTVIDRWIPELAD